MGTTLNFAAILAALTFVGLVVVGAPFNTEHAKTVGHPGKAKHSFAKQFDDLTLSNTASKWRPIR